MSTVLHRDEGWEEAVGLEDYSLNGWERASKVLNPLQIREKDAGDSDALNAGCHSSRTKQLEQRLDSLWSTRHNDLFPLCDRRHRTTPPPVSRSLCSGSTDDYVDINEFPHPQQKGQGPPYR